MTLTNQIILDYIAAHPGARREEIRRQAVPEASQTTVWRQGHGCHIPMVQNKKVNGKFS